ncbi:MAG: IS1182 family transposase [bacterium]|nr:IS1182 family transposase [bacterium]
MGFMQGLDRHQLYMAASLEDSIATNNPVRIIDYLVDTLDLKKLGFLNAVPTALGRPACHGRPAYSANDLLKLYLYGYQQGIRSSRKLENELGRNTELRWLLGGLRPDHKTIAEFRRKNPKSFQKAFREFVAMLDSWDLLGKETFALDGSKIKASNNKKQNFSKKKLKERSNRIDEKIMSFVHELEDNDQREDQAPVVNVQETIERLKKRKEQYEGYLKAIESSGENEISLVDPDARLMGNNRGGVEMSYNVQSAVDEKHCLVVETNVTNNPSDHGQLSIMGKRIRKRLKIRNFTLIADKGYYNGLDLKRCKKHKITTIVARQKTGKEAPDKDYNNDKFIYDKKNDSYTCPAGEILSRSGAKGKKEYKNQNACRICPHKDKCTTAIYKRLILSNYQAIFEETDKRTAAKKELYKKRQMMVEHPFGTIKHTMNGHYFLLRTLKKVRGEVALLFFAYNLKRVQNILGFEGIMERLGAYPLRFSLYIAKSATFPAFATAI